MSHNDEGTQPPSGRTEITLVTGDHLCVEGDAKSVEGTILGAARGSIMEFAWFVDARSGDEVGVNPEHVALLRNSDSQSAT
jgi:hypothetical protein